MLAVGILSLEIFIGVNGGGRVLCILTFLFYHYGTVVFQGLIMLLAIGSCQFLSFSIMCGYFLAHAVKNKLAARNAVSASHTVQIAKAQRGITK